MEEDGEKERKKCESRRQEEGQEKKEERDGGERRRKSFLLNAGKKLSWKLNSGGVEREKHSFSSVSLVV